MAKLKALIFSLDNVALKEGGVTPHHVEVDKLIRFIQTKGILPIVLANRNWSVTDRDTGKKADAEEHFKPYWGNFPWYVSSRGDCPQKPNAAAIAFILKKHGLAPNEVAFLGNDEMDMRTAVNGNVLFLTASWFAPATEYGFAFATPLEVARLNGVNYLCRACCLTEECYPLFCCLCYRSLFSKKINLPVWPSGGRRGRSPPLPSIQAPKLDGDFDLSARRFRVRRHLPMRTRAFALRRDARLSRAAAACEEGELDTRRGVQFARGEAVRARFDPVRLAATKVFAARLTRMDPSSFASRGSASARRDALVAPRRRATLSPSS